MVHEPVSSESTREQDTEQAYAVLVEHLVSQKADLLFKDLWDAGFFPEALVQHLLQQGEVVLPEDKEFSLAQAAEYLSKLELAEVVLNLDKEKLSRLNAQLISRFPLERIAAQAKQFVGEYLELISAKNDSFWIEAVSVFRPNMRVLADAGVLAEILFSLEVSADDQARAFIEHSETAKPYLQVLELFRELVEQTPLAEDQDSYTKEQFNKMLKTIKKQLSLDAKTIRQAISTAITGRLSGMELKRIVPLITRDLLRERIS